MLVCAPLAACGGERESASPARVRAPATIRLSSPAFADGARLPVALTCDGAGRPPALSWSRVPAAARALVLTVEDPDAPGGTFVHWVVAYRVDGARRTVVAEGENSAGKRGWTPPCPPRGDKPHRYVFALYALARPSGLRDGAQPKAVRDALSSGVLARGTLTGTYARR